MIKLQKRIFIVIFIFLLTAESKAVIKDRIFATVGDKVITRSDVINEIKTILILNDQVYSEDIKLKLDNAAINSLTNRLIKKIEIEKYPTLRFEKEDVFKEIKNYATNLNMDVDAFKQVFVTNEINFSSIMERIEIGINDMRIDVVADETVYINLNGWTYYIDDSTGEQILEKYKEKE